MTVSDDLFRIAATPHSIPFSFRSYHKIGILVKVGTYPHFCALLGNHVGICTKMSKLWAMKADARQHQKISVLLPVSDAERFEAYCQEFGHKKSTLIARLVRDFLNQENFPAQRSIELRMGRDK